MLPRIFLLPIFILVIAAPASALDWSAPSSRAGTFEVSLQTRYTGSRDASFEGGSSISMEDDLGWGFGFAYNFGHRFSLGTTMSWRSAYYQATLVDGTDPTNTETIASQMDMSNIALTGNWNIMRGALTPYVTGSVGWMIINSNIPAGSASGCWWYPWWGYVCGSVPLTYGADAVTGIVGGGLRYEPNQTMFLRAGYEYGWASEDPVEGAHVVRFEIGLVL